jgi:hypothetical protein
MDINMETVQITNEIYDRLKALAEPLVDDVSSVIGRLLDHWDTLPPKSRSLNIIISKKRPLIWQSARGEKFVVGTKLRATYRKNTFESVVTESGIEFDGEFYDNPSSAGIAAKKSVGISDAAASTNGWKFWEMLDPDSGRWISIDVLR